MGKNLPLNIVSILTSERK